MYGYEYERDDDYGYEGEYGDEEYGDEERIDVLAGLVAVKLAAAWGWWRGQ